MRYFKRYIPWKYLTRIAVVACCVIPILLFRYYLLGDDGNGVGSPLKKIMLNNQTISSGLISLHPMVSQKKKLQKVQSGNEKIKNSRVIRFGHCQEKMTLAIVVCGDRKTTAMVALKSVLAMALSPVHLAIIADDSNREQVAEEILDWPSVILRRLSFEIHPISFPGSKMEDEWKKLFKLCAAQRLFLPTVLGDIDSVVYVDTDVVFLQPLDELWKYFKKMNSSQMAALSHETEDYATGWYNRFARHPFYKPLGVNSGVMLMNLTRMRAFQWHSYLEPIFHEYKLKIVWGDQDIINIIFHYHPDKLLIFGCEWNYRPDHCMYSLICKSASVRGISILHGNRGVFTNGKQPSFRAVFAAFESYELGSDLERHLLQPLKLSLKLTTKTNCGSNNAPFLRKLRETVLRLKTHEYHSTCKTL